MTAIIRKPRPKPASKKSGLDAASSPRVTMGRPRHDGREPLSRDDILREAQRQFLSHGYANTSTRGLAEALGAYASSIYHHFPSKESIFDEIVSEMLGPYVRYFRRAQEWDLPPEAALYRLVYDDSFYVASRGHGLQMLLLVQEGPEGKFPLVRKTWMKFRETYQGILQSGITSGVFIEVDTNCYAEHFMSLACTILLSRDRASLGSPERQATAAASLALRSVLKNLGRLDAIRRQVAAARQAEGD